MCVEERIVEILNSHYGVTSLLKYSESEDEIWFRLPAPVRDTAVFRSRATILHELSLSHRLSLSVGRGKYGVPEDSAFAIKSVESVVHTSDAVDAYDVSLRFEILARRRDTITALKSTLVTNHRGEACRTATSFNVLPLALANFVRRSRKFLDFAELKMNRDQSSLANVADNHFRYFPSEADRLSDGRRVDHVPALTLIDIALSINKMAAYSNISADFLNYTDPRVEFDIFQKDAPCAIEFVQNDQLVAVVSARGSNRPEQFSNPGEELQATSR